MSLTSSSVVKRNAALLSTRVDNDIFILNPVRDNYIGLDEIGRRVWDLIEAPISVDHLSRQMAKEYQGDLPQIPADMIAFLNELNDEGLLEVRQ
jgi:hypothetical protein